MSKGTAKEVEMWGIVLRLGDKVRIKHSYGGMGEIQGKIIELWGYETDGHLQARLDSGWCFHHYDELLSHVPKDKAVPKQYRAQLAGPITGMPDQNRQAFAAAAEKVESLGYRVWNPNDWSDLGPDIDPDRQPREFWMRRAIRHLFEADLLVMLPGWMPSDGAMAERVVARQFGMPIVYLFDHPGAYRCEWRR